MAATTAGGTPAFIVGEDEYAFDITFGAAVQGDGAASPRQAATCTLPDGMEVPFRVGEEQPTGTNDLRIFAGVRLDPFFINLQGVLATEAQEQLAFRPGAANFLEGMNVLAIVIELDVARVLGSDTGPLVAVVGEP